MKKLNLLQCKKSFICLGILISAIVCMCGCGEKEKNGENTSKAEYSIEKMGTELKNDSIYIVGENINYHLYSQISGVTGFQLECISGNELSPDDLEVTIEGITTPYNVVLEKVENEDMDVFLFAEYCGADWEKLKKLQEKEVSAYNEKMKEYEIQLENSKKDIGTIYHYLIGINFKFLEYGTTESFQNVTVRYKEQTYEKEIGNVILDYEKKYKNGESMQTECVAASDLSAWKNVKGEMECNIEDMFRAVLPITINNIELLENDAKLSSCEVNTVCANKGMDYEWCQDAIELEKDTKLGMKIKLQKEECANQFYYQYNNYILITYKDKNKNYEAVGEVCFRTKMSAYELYAYYLDHKDLTEYMNFVYNK